MRTCSACAVRSPNQSGLNQVNRFSFNSRLMPRFRPRLGSWRVRQPSQAARQATLPGFCAASTTRPPPALSQVFSPLQRASRESSRQAATIASLASYRSPANMGSPGLRGGRTLVLVMLALAGAFRLPLLSPCRSSGHSRTARGTPYAPPSQRLFAGSQQTRRPRTPTLTARCGCCPSQGERVVRHATRTSSQWRTLGRQPLFECNRSGFLAHVSRGLCSEAESEEVTDFGGTCYRTISFPSQHLVLGSFSHEDLQVGGVPHVTRRQHRSCHGCQLPEVLCPRLRRSSRDTAAASRPFIGIPSFSSMASTRWWGPTSEPMQGLKPAQQKRGLLGVSGRGYVPFCMPHAAFPMARHRDLSAPLAHVQLPVPSALRHPGTGGWTSFPEVTRTH